MKEPSAPKKGDPVFPRNSDEPLFTAFSTMT
jgi:hypothetical protein